MSWEDTAELLSQQFPLDAEGEADERPRAVAERVPAAVQAANTLRQLERAGEEQSFLLTTFGGELVKINDNLKKITAGMTDLGVIRRTVLSQDNQIRNLARMMTETIEELGAVQSAALRQQAAIQSVREEAPAQAADAAPVPDAAAEAERSRELYAVLDRLGQLQSSMAYVIKQFERRSQELENKYEQAAAAHAPAPAMPCAAPEPPRAEPDPALHEEIRHLRSLLKERDEEISQLQGTNRRLRIETDALKSRVSELSRIEPAEPAPPMRQPMYPQDKMAGGKLFFRATSKKK